MLPQVQTDRDDRIITHVGLAQADHEVPETRIKSKSVVIFHSANICRFTPSREIPAILAGYRYDTSSLFTGILYTPSVLVMRRGAATFCPSLSVSFFFILETLV